MPRRTELTPPPICAAARYIWRRSNARCALVWRGATVLRYVYLVVVIRTTCEKAQSFSIMQQYSRMALLRSNAQMEMGKDKSFLLLPLLLPRHC